MSSPARAREAMREGGGLSDTDSDETVVEGSVVESELEDEELHGQRLALFGKDMASAGIKILNGEKLSPEIQPIRKHRIDPHIGRETELINLPYQETDNKQESQSLLPVGINYPVIATNICEPNCPPPATVPGDHSHFIYLNSKVNGFQVLSEKNRLNDEDSPEISLLSGIDAIEELSKYAVTKCTTVSEAFQNVRMTSNQQDMIANGQSIEAVASDITTSRIMAGNVEVKDFMILSDSENSQMPSPLFDILNYQNDALSMGASINGSNALPEELLTALNSLSDSVVPPVFQPVEKGSGHSLAQKWLRSELTDDYTQIHDTDFDSQLHLQHLEETELLMENKLPCLSGEQFDCDQTYKLINSDHLTEKGDSNLKETSSCQQIIQISSYTLRKSARKRKEIPYSDVDNTSNGQRCLEETHQKIHSDRAEARLFEAQDSNTKEKSDQQSQLRTGSLYSSASDENTKVEQMRKSQRIDKKSRKQTASKNCSSDSSFSHISLSSINRRDVFGQRLLHRAVMQNNVGYVCAVIKAGASVNVQDYAGWTPLHEASVAGFYEITNELLKAGADVNCKGSEEVTPLHDAVKEGHYKVAELLLWYGADPLVKNEKGKSALEEATDKCMRLLLENYAAKSSGKSASAERLIEDPAQSRANKNQSLLKVKPNSDDQVQLSYIDHKTLKQHSIKQNKEKRNLRSNSVSTKQESYKIRNETLKSPSLVSKSKQPVTEKPPSSLNTSRDKTKMNGQRKNMQNDSGHTTSVCFSKRIVRPSRYHRYNPDGICEAAEESSMLTESDIQQENNSSNNVCLLERKEVHKSTEPSGATNGQATNSLVATPLVPVQEGSVLSSVTGLVNEPDLDSDRPLCKDTSPKDLDLLAEGQCTVKHSNVSSCLKAHSLGDNLHTAEKMKFNCTIGEGEINPANERNISPEQYMHSENLLDQINPNCHTGIFLEHGVAVKDPFPVAEPISLEVNLLESQSTTSLLLQGSADFGDSDCTVLSEQYALNADKSPGKNAPTALGIHNEQTLQVSMEMYSTSAFSHGINLADVTESPDTYNSNELRTFIPHVHGSLMMGSRAEENIGRCPERMGNGSVLGNNTILDIQMCDQELFQDGALQIEITGRCYNEADGKEHSSNNLDQHIQLDSSHSSEKKKTSYSSQLQCTTTDRTNKIHAKGETRLHLAAKKGDLSVVKSLVASGACVNNKDNAGRRHLRSAKSRRSRFCHECCGKDNLVSLPSAASQKSGTHESMSKIEEMQDRLLLFKLRNPRDADRYIQDLSQIQNLLNAVLAKQKSERDDLVKKYRASAESFKQGTLREQIVKLVSRQKSLLLMAQKQKELGRKIQNYKNAKKKSSSSAKQVPSTLSSCENNNTEEDTSDKTVPCPGDVGLETSWVMESSFLDQEISQCPSRSLNVSGGSNDVIIIQKEVDPHNLMSENMFRTYTINEVLNSKSSDATDEETLPSEPFFFIQTKESEETDSIVVAPQGNKLSNGTPRIYTQNIIAAENFDVNINESNTEGQHVCTKSLQQYSNINEAFQMQPILVLESTYSYVATHQNNISPNNRISLNANLEPKGIFSGTLSPSRISQHSSQGSDNQESEKQLNFKASRISQNSSQCSNIQESEKQLNYKANRRKKNQLQDLLEVGKIKPGDDVLEFTLQGSKHKASLLQNGKVKTGNNLVFQNPVQWIKALLGNDISVSWKYVWNKVTYCGTLLSEIIAEVHIPKEPELPLQKERLLGTNSTANSTERDHSCGAECRCSSYKAPDLQDADCLQEKATHFLQEEMEILPSETEAEETLSLVREIKSSYQPKISENLRFLQFNEIVLIKDEEFLPCHIMDQYWNFYVHCENFGF
ncbi:ankyrin repeat domain-containing protein 31 isoform X2 [Hemicordylus capensis]|uniref:ankyrin repeat domain-containing protein 31 isoform X2 n=1 Tax=Hemicordylus capensis TaxID=884348 RepID=UPI0023025CC5|nr:ankyrin repeat domain-containing protein 31 isoform X2 [Hemicordylus capensis]